MKQSKNEYLYQLVEECIEALDNKNHAAFEHSYMTDERLKSRIANKTSAVNGSSCFNAGDDVAEIIADIIYDANEVLPWLKHTTTEDLRLIIESENCGKKFLKTKEHDWSKGALPCNSIVVVLGKTLDMAGCVTNMFIKTAYPI